MRHFISLLIFAVPAIAVASPALAEDSPEMLAISGTVDTSFDGIDAAGLEVEINGVSSIAQSGGGFAAQVGIAPYYRIRITGAAIYPSVQTFGVEELYRAECDCLRVPSLGVVAQKTGRVELFFAGDAMAGRRFSTPIWGERQLVDPADPLPDIAALLEPIRPYLEASDLASVNLETVLAGRDAGNAPPKMVVFFSPPELADALAQAGFDYVTLGNNHSYDYLEAGIANTVAALDRVGLQWSGAGMGEEEALRPSRMTVRGQDLSLLGYVGWKGRVEPNQVAETDKGGAAFGSDANIGATVSREAEAGRIVIAQYHGSMEYSDGPTPESERRMKLAIDSGAALVASHHPHVTHGLEFYNGGLIAYSMGNFLFDQYFLETHGAFALKVWLDEGKVVRAELIPLRILDYRPVPAVGSMRRAVLDRITRLSAERSTFVGRNGGHGLLLPGRSASIDTPSVADAGPCRAASDVLFAGGDFEAASLGDARDRSLKLDGGQIGYRFHGRSGSTLELDAAPGQRRLLLWPATFFRALSANQVTLCGKIWAPQPVRLQLGMQYREKGAGRMEALETAPLTLSDGGTSIPAREWTDFQLSVSIPQASVGLPARPGLRISLDSDGASFTGSMALDDLVVAVGD